MIILKYMGSGESYFRLKYIYFTSLTQEASMAQGKER